ncbi:hypothetical protein TRSC58_04636 [Trypanosoma rangeli SC58]|uniref:Uncharacterized protein n=1 Tax=Trypanosoma rangeli SC58 TaxID=429131 RepID=A0A061J0N9_TRYRA|nr:hypothetical protein TRSC58_04636 [Trypanosoma rangeli SC58]
MPSSPSNEYVPWLVPRRAPTSPPHSLPASVSLSSSSWELLELSHAVSPRNINEESVSLHSQLEATLTSPPQIVQSTVSASSVTRGWSHQEEVSWGWSVLSSGQSQPQSGHGLCDFPAPEHPVSKVPSMHQGKLDSFRAEDSSKVSEEDGSCGFFPYVPCERPCEEHLQRRTALPFIKSSCFHSPPSMGYLSFRYISPFGLGNGGAACMLFCSGVYPMLNGSCREKIPSESSPADSSESSVAFDVLYSPTTGAWDDINRNEEDNSHTVEDDSGDSSGKCGSDPDGEGNSLHAQFFFMPILRSVLRHIELMTASQQCPKVQTGRRRHGRGKSGRTTREREGWPHLVAWFSSEVETLLSCTLHGIIVFML